jgi:hypothetical protein
MLPLDFHEQECARSLDLYLEGRNPEQGALDWRQALYESRRLIIDALRKTSYLTAIPEALRESGRHTLVLRHFLAPPISQDQLKLICPSFPKGAEKTGAPVSAARAEAIGEIFSQWRSRRLTSWLDAGRTPTRRQLYATIDAVAPLIASQQVATAQRHRLSTMQEQAIVTLLLEKGWARMPSRPIRQAAELPPKHFMHKTRFISGPNENQEVDIACGLPNTVVLAVECKVTNDRTNSVKRMNDVLKKAAAWREQWGRLITSAAVLQGVINFADVKRLLDNGVEVFWGHRMDLFSEWLDTHL